MIDARGWTRPTPAEVRALVERTGLNKQQVGSRLGVGERRVRHWVSQASRDGRRISYVEDMALVALVQEEREKMGVRARFVSLPRSAVTAREAS